MCNVALFAPWFLHFINNYRSVLVCLFDHFAAVEHSCIDTINYFECAFPDKNCQVNDWGITICGQFSNPECNGVYQAEG